MQDLKKLIDGFKRFQKHHFVQDKSLYAELCKGQRPEILVIGCSDSRVDPAILTDCKPGDMFVVRDVANLVPPYHQDVQDDGVSSAIEYAVKYLNVKHVIILGHSHCGGIDSLMHCSPEHPGGEFIDHWMTIVQAARDAVQKELADKPEGAQLRACEQASLLISLKNLLTFPWVAQRVQDGRLTLHGWYFDMDTGELLSYDAKTGTFETLA